MLKHNQHLSSLKCVFLNLPILSLLLLWSAALTLLPTSQTVEVFPTSYFPLHKNMHLLKCCRGAPISFLVALCSAKCYISTDSFPCPQTRWICAMIQYNCKCLSCPPQTHSGHLYSAQLQLWFASILTREFECSSEWGLLQLKIQAGGRDEVNQSMGKIQEKWLCSSSCLGPVLPPQAVEKCSLLGMKPLTAEQLQAEGNQPAPKALNTLGLASVLRLKVQKMENLQEV